MNYIDSEPDYIYTVPGKDWLRSERVFFINDGWFFQTRDYGNVGPFDTQMEAESSIQKIIDFLNSGCNPAYFANATAA